MVFSYPHDYKSPLPRCVIQVDGMWYDCTAWRHSHPGGAELIDRFHQQDATEAFYAFHSQEAVAKLKKMRGKPAEGATSTTTTSKNNNNSSDGTGSLITPQRDSVSIAFEKFRKQLLQDGWYERRWEIDFLASVLPVLVMVALGFYWAWSYPVLSTILLGVGMQQAGWIGHDYSHGRGKISQVLGIGLGALINGFSTAWWGNKHNAHHTFPNRKDHDGDIDVAPFLHLWKPDPAHDVWWRKYQHYFYLLAYSLLYVSWRLQSITFVLGSRNWLERSLIAANYIALACLPWKVAIGSILFGGWLVAIVVTANHQTEEILDPEDKYNFVVDQFRTTRGVACPDYLTEYLFGGMQYQLEHHLFPTIPRYYYPQLRPLVKQFAKENGLQYHVSGMVEIMKMNYDVMKKYSE